MPHQTKNLGMLALAIVVSGACIIAGAYVASRFAVADEEEPEIREIAQHDDDHRGTDKPPPDRLHRLSDLPSTAPRRSLEALVAKQDEQDDRDEPGEELPPAQDDDETSPGSEEDAAELKLRAAERMGDGVGPARWMAEPDDVDVEKLEQELDRGQMEQEFELSRRADRRRSIEVVEEEVDRCYQAWTSRTQDSRVALRWTMITDAGEATIVDPEITTWRGPEDRRFEQCVVDGLTGQTFEAEGDGAEMVVRWAAQSR